MSVECESGGVPPFPGLRPTTRPEPPAPATARGRAWRVTLPFVVASAMTVSLGTTGVQPAYASVKKPPKPKASLGTGTRTVTPPSATATSAASPSLPASHTVAAGDTVASIAEQYGVATASLLAANGLGWTTRIHPGQVLRLTTPRPAPAPAEITTRSEAAPRPAAATDEGRHTVVAGDTLARLADRFGVTVQSLLDANGLSWSSILYPGLVLQVPDGGTIAASAPESPVPAPPAAPEPTPEPVAVATAPRAPRGYVIRSGDTVSSIASAFGVSVAALLAANGLGTSSIIYPGSTLVIPAGGGAPASAAGGGGAAPAGGGSGGGGSVTSLTAEQAGNARLIIEVGRSLGVPDYGIIIALATAMQESSLRNLGWGDRDSVGLFQQRPSTGWGTVAELTDPYHATYLFFHGRSGYTRGLLDIAGWQSMALTVAAQKVQISAYPNAYAKWETSARAWFALYG